MKILRKGQWPGEPSVYLTAILLLVLATAGILGCTKTPPGEPEIKSPGDIALRVWDCIQPRFPGSPPFEEDVRRIADEFSKSTGVSVNVEIAERSSIIEYMSQGPREGGPDVVFSTEWPEFPDWLRQSKTQVPPMEEQGGGDNSLYLDVAYEYWLGASRQIAAPSYINWICMAVEAEPAGTGAAESNSVSPDSEVVGPTGYFIDSPAFVESLLGHPSSWTAESLSHGLVQVRDSLGTCKEDPLSLWSGGGVKALYPVTPHLFKWLRLSDQKRNVEILETPVPLTEGAFFYTVPAYVVLSESEPERTLAMELADRLASALGRWAARSVGGIPARVTDLPVFQVESGLSQAERERLLSGLKLSTPLFFDSPESDREREMSRKVLAIARDYLSGKLTQEEMQKSISEAVGSHTNP